MRAWLLTICGTLLCLTGCRTLQRDGKLPTCAEGPALSEREEAFAEALAHYGQGLLYHAEEGSKSARALEEFQAAAAEDPGNHDLLSRIAVAAIHRKEMDVAIEALERSYHHDPKSYERCVDLAAGYQAAKRHEDAVAFYRKALKRDDSRGTVYVAIAGLHFHNQQDKQALRALDRGKKLAANVGLVQLYVYEQAKRFIADGTVERAIPCFHRLADWDEARRPQFLHVLAELHLAVGDERASIKVLTEAVELDNAMPESFIDLATLYLREDRPRGLKLLQQAATRMPEDPSILFALGCIHSDFEDYEAALPLFEKARSIALAAQTDEEAPTPLTEVFFLYHGSAYERTGKLEKAEEIFEECIQNHPESHRVLNYLAYTWAEADMKLDRALEYVNRALKLVPDSAPYRDTLGWIHFKQGRFEDSLTELEKASKLMGPDAEILDHLGEVHNALGNKAVATSYWRESYALDPKNEAVATKLKKLGINPDAVLLDSVIDGTGEQD